MPYGIDRETRGAYDGILAPVRGHPSAAPQNGPDAGHQLARAVRLGHVVVRAQLQAEQDVVLGRAGGEHQDGDVVVRAQHPAHPEPVDHREHQIQDDQVRGDPAGRVQRGPPVVDHGGGVTLREQGASYQLGLHLVVLGDQHMCAHAADPKRFSGPGTRSRP